MKSPTRSPRRRRCWRWEGGSFDASGRHFLATVFQYHDGAPGGGIEVFRVVDGATPRLERLGRLPMPHGVHHGAIAR